VDNHPFFIANYRSETGEAKAHTRIGWYRAVYAIFYGFAFGSIADELAHKTKKDTVSLLNSIYEIIKMPNKLSKSLAQKVRWLWRLKSLIGLTATNYQVIKG